MPTSCIPRPIPDKKNPITKRAFKGQEQSIKWVPVARLYRGYKLSTLYSSIGHA
ncbi:unnamed protein product [Dovyalis caffra]|uniref:Uncharacterized protein n=1 Tax=Dovyalis caffra TaxID=77055 RepID=A0AAV1SM66_9ROSI|nr:unnamed protein product [Dovyalis caffra]